MISVCIATYNGERFVKEQLNSILTQLEDGDEVIVSDDGSTDKTISLIEGFKDPRVHLYKNSFRNVILNFEFAISKANGDYIFLSDQDDIWYNNKVEIYSKLLKSTDLIFSNVSVFTSNRDENYPLYDINKDCSGFIYNLIKNKCIGATMAFNSKFTEVILPFPKKIEMHDMWIFFTISLFGKANYVKTPLIYYRRHGDNVTNSTGKTQNSILKIISIRLIIVFALLKRYVFVNSRPNKIK